MSEKHPVSSFVVCFAVPNLKKHFILCLKNIFPECRRDSNRVLFCFLSFFFSQFFKDVLPYLLTYITSTKKFTVLYISIPLYITFLFSCGCIGYSIYHCFYYDATWYSFLPVSSVCSSLILESVKIVIKFVKCLYFFLLSNSLVM